ncbi:MAG: RagB/SusD family nutrient uptake outer membrane protein [Mangrovibacterium sp.]
MKDLFIILIMISLSIVSCDTLDEDIVSGLTSEYLDTSDGLDAGVNGAYEPLSTFYGQEEGCNMSVFGTDEYTNAGHGGYHYMNQYIAGLNADESSFWNLWSNFYIGINTCNTVVSRASVSDLPDEEKNPKIAEARFLRAYYYFVLVRYFGPVTLTLEETTDVETEASRSPESDVYEAIVEDLEFAVSNLPVVQDEFGRPTQLAAKHLLALVYLTRGYADYAETDDFATAASLAESVIHDYGLSLDADPVARYDHDNEQHEEILWSVQFDEDPLLMYTDDEDTYGNETHLYFRPWYETYNSGLVRALGTGYGRPWIRYRPTGWLLNSFRVNGTYDVDSRFNKGFQQVWYYNSEDGIPAGASVGDTAIFLTGNHLTRADVDAIEARLPGVIAGKNLYSWHEEDKGTAWSWYSEDEDGSNNNSLNIFPCPWKFEDNKRPSVNYQEGSRDVIICSLPETYLIAAEALLKDNKPDDAVEYVNAIRTRAAYSGKENKMIISAAELDLDFILDERSRELFGEERRWLDLKRTGKLIERVKLYNLQAAPNIDEHHLLRPIPANQLTRTSNDYGQNDGY